jgi:DNA polymerase-3 subunit gamma/tau
VLARLEDISRTSWLIASTATVAALADDVLTLTFQSQSDVAKFKQLAAGKGPSEDLRQAILAVLGIRVKYIARHDPAGGSGGISGPAGPGGAGGAGMPASSPTGPGRETSRQAGVPEAPAARTTAAAPSAPGSSQAPAPRASALADPRGSAPAAARASAPAAPRASAPASAPASAVAVTDWAVAPIPSDDDAPPPDPGPAAFPAETPAPLAVDDEPEDAEAATARVATLAPPREGQVLPRTEIAPPLERDDDDDDEDTDALIADLPVPPTVAPPLTPVVTTRNGGVQRYGEAVVRQVLGATFVREEPYEPPTRFS